MKLAFKVLCTKSEDNRFEVGNVYSIYYKHISNGKINVSYLTLDEDENCAFTGRLISEEMLDDIPRFFKHWYDLCCWANYDFKLVHNEYSVNLI